MKICVITMWRNEEFLAPFFLRHYSWADEIHIVLDSDTTDRTAAIVRDTHRVTLSSISFPNGFDNELRSSVIYRYSQESDADWLIVVDSDEFLFHPTYGDPRLFLLHETADVIFARMWQVFRAATEAPLCSDLPPLFQRRYGDPNRTRGKNALYNKPCIFRPMRGIELSAGNHFFRAPVGTRIARRQFYGVHWSFADVDEAVRRLMFNGKHRLSQSDFDKGYGTHLQSVTEQSIRQYAQQMEVSPLLLRSRYFMVLMHSLNSFLILAFYARMTWIVPDSSRWHDGRQLDLLDVWADRRWHVSRLFRAIRNLAIGSSGC